MDIEPQIFWAHNLDLGSCTSSVMWPLDLQHMVSI